jgi:hypothetical protein
MTDFRFSQPFYQRFESIAASFLMIKSIVIVPTAGTCEMSLVFYQAARHHIPKYFETLFA